MHSKAWRWFALALPLVVLGGGIVRGERAVRTGDTFYFDIGGYDPRDLLRGRYLQFRIEERWGESYDVGDTDADCACLERTGNKTTPTLRGASCAFARSGCESFITHDSLSKLDRYYIPEARARELEKTLQSAQSRDSAQIVVSVGCNGDAAIIDLLVDGQPILEK